MNRIWVTGQFPEDYWLGRLLLEECANDGDFEKLLIPKKQFQQDFRDAKGVPKSVKLKSFVRGLFSVPRETIRSLNPQDGLPPGCLIVETPWFDTWIPYQLGFSHQVVEKFDPYSRLEYISLERFVDISELFMY